MRIKTVNSQARDLNNNGRAVDITFTGPLILSGAPTGPRDAATKKYVDDTSSALNIENLTSGFVQAARVPAFTGDVTNVAGTTNFTLNPTMLATGTATKYTVDVKGRIVATSPLAASDIPVLHWNKITSGKPSTLSGYGIENGVALSGGILTNGLRINATPTLSTHAVNREFINSLITGSAGSVPTGTIITSSSSAAKSGYLRSNGGAVSKETYAALYAVLGDKYSRGTGVGGGQPWHNQELSNEVTALPSYAQMAATGTLPATLSMPCVFAINRYVYVTGGGGVATYRASILANGKLGPFAQVTDRNLVTAIGYTKAVIVKNYVHIVCGWTTGPSTQIMSAKILPNGDIGPWVGSAGLFPTYNANYVYTGQYLYVLGGRNTSDNAGAHSRVCRITINNNGSLGAMTEVTALPTTMVEAAVAITKRGVYLIGGWSTRTVLFAPINADGTIGTWVTETQLPVAMGFANAYVTKNKIVMINNPNSNVTMSANIDANGVIGTWTVGATLPATYGTDNSRMVRTKNYIHIFPDRVATVYSIPLAEGVDDFTPWHDGSAGSIPSAGDFRIPDYSLKEYVGNYYFIKI